MIRILLSSFFHTAIEICILVLPGIILGLAVNYVSDRLEFRARRAIGERPYTLLFRWLGTSVYELSHALMCVVFRHRIEKIKLFSLDPKTRRVGYVAHKYKVHSIYHKDREFLYRYHAHTSGSVGHLFLCMDFLPRYPDSYGCDRNYFNGLFLVLEAWRVFPALCPPRSAQLFRSEILPIPVCALLHRQQHEPE